MTKLAAEERPRMTLEDYILFYASRQGHGLTIDHLNQIIFMHGFIKLHRHQKSLIVGALNSFDLMHPRRSTVGPAALLAPPPPPPPLSAAAALSVEEVKRDIDDLGWRECPVGSLLAVGGATAVPLASIPPGAEGVSSSSRLSASSPAVAKRKGKEEEEEEKGSRKKTKKRVTALLTLPSLDMASA